MTSETRISLNLSAVNSAVVVHAVQNDRLARHIIADLFDGADAWTPPAGALAIIRYLKPDGTAGYYDTDENEDPAISISGNTATLTIAEQALTVPGDVLMQLNFYTAGDEKLTSLRFIIRVQASVLDDATIVSSDYYNVLTELVADAAADLALAQQIAADLPAPSGTTPLADVAGGAVGSGPGFAYGDHQHPLIYPDADNVQALALDGHSIEVNVVSDLNSFVSGLAVFQPSTTNAPFSSWGFVTSAGDSYTRMQVAYSFDATVPPKRRDLSGGTWSAWSDLTTQADSGWIEVTFTADFKNYGTTNKCQYRKVGNVVTVCGAATPVNDIAGSNTQYTMFTLPVGFRPKVVLSSIQQGSGNCRWQMQIGSGNGAVTFSRYADENGAATAAGGSPGAWLVFAATFLTA